jgi:hypothetical protein
VKVQLRRAELDRDRSAVEQRDDRICEGVPAERAGTPIEWT